MTGEPVDLSEDAPGRPKEARRLEALRRFDFVDPQPGDILDRFARLAAQVFDTAFAALCFVEGERVHFIARHGIESAECPRTGSFFDETIRQDDIVWIADARDVAPFRDSTLVTKPPAIRFYAGAPLRTPDGLAIGVLCVMDPKPRPLADLATRGALKDLAACAMSEMECWRLNRELEAMSAQHDEKLRELDLIYERAPIGLTLIDRDLRFRRINQRLADFNGKAIEEHIGRTLREVVPDLAETLEPMLRGVLETGEPLLDYEFIGETAREPGVERVWMGSYYPIPEAGGGVGEIAVVVQDVTERKAAEAALIDSEKLFRETFEQTAVGMAHVSLDGQWLRVNDRLCDIVGDSRAALLRKTFQDITHPEDVAADVENAKRLLGGEVESYVMEKRYVRADGTVRWVNVTVSLQRTSTGEPDHFIAVIEDITTRKKAEDRLAVVVSELKHRVKNTLATIQSVIAHAARAPGSKHAFVESVAGRIQAMASAHDLLVRSQWQGAAFADLITEEFRPYGLHRVRIDGPVLWLTPNAALAFRLMIHELATNAAKYGALSRDEGRIFIDWTVAEVNGERSLRFSWEERGGPTVPPPSKRGFGSEIVEKYAAKELSGTLSIQFEPDGVRVSLHAPVREIAALSPPDFDQRPDTMAAAPVSTPRRVFVVEDSALIAMDLESILADAGHTVIGPASTVAEALALVDEGMVDVALLDIDLHGEIVTPVAERLADRGLPFAFLTGFEQGGSPVPVYADAPVLRKPFDGQSVLTTLAALVAAKSR